MEMETKNLMVFFLAIVSVLFLVATNVSAATTELATMESVQVNGIYDQGHEDIAVVAGEKITVKVIFTALETASDVRTELEVEGSKVDVTDRSQPFDVEKGIRYTKILSVVIPYELKDEVSDDLAMNVKIWNGDFKTEHSEITLRVQRPSYNVGIMSIETSQSVQAGETLPVDVVLKNIGYNYLNDLYVTVTIPELGIERTSYFGDLVAVECNDEDSCDTDDKDNMVGRFYLKIPYETKKGIYTVKVDVKNEDLSASDAKQIVVENDFSSGNVVVNGNKLIVLNPTNSLKVYRIIPQTTEGVIVSVSESVVVIPAGGSKTVDVKTSGGSKGTYNFKIDVFSGESLVSTVTMSNTVDQSKASSPIVILTIILAIIFIVLLIVLIVLIGKKPEQSEEFGESYY